MLTIKKSILSLLIFTGFFVTAQNGITISDSILSNNIYRKYRIYIPNSYNSSQAVPLLFNLHGYTSNALQQQYYGDFMPIADTAKFIMVLPEGTAPLGNQYFNAGFGPGANDLLFMTDLIDSISLNYNINQNRIYSCGMSNGGIMSYYLACNITNRFAAIASVTGSMLKNWFVLTPTRAVPVMHIHGTNDGTVPYAGDATFAPVDSIVKKWRVHNQCLPTPTITNVPNINTTDGATATHYLYSGSNADVEFYKINNGAHTWPGANFVINVTCQDFNASYEIWRFFSKYELSMFTNISNEDKVNEFQLFPNPANNELYILNTEFISSTYKFYNVLGKEVSPLLLYNGFESKYDLSELNSGFYFVYRYHNNTLIDCKKIIKN